MKSLRFAAAIALVCSAIGISAQSPIYRDPAPEPQRGSATSRDGFFAVPMIGRTRVDRCLHWGTECDQPAADQFCRQQGYTRAADFTTRLASPTFIMGENQVCNRSDCAALENVRCVRGDLRGNDPYRQGDSYRPSDPYRQNDARDTRNGMGGGNNFFPVPQINRTRVDWCLHWGTGCGKAAADGFCQQQGFRHAEDFSYRPARPTLVLGDNQVCNRADCQALENVRCGGLDREPQRHDWERNNEPAGRDQRFPSPSVRGRAVDRCLYRGRSCDQPAADQFCALQGFRRAVDFTVTPFSPTLVLSENTICTSGCHAFSQITCTNR